MSVHIRADSAFTIILLRVCRNKPPLCGFPRRLTNKHQRLVAAQRSKSPNEEKQPMYKLVFIAGAFAIMSAPALASSATSDKPMVVAETGVSVSVGDRDHDHDRDRDRDRHHKVIVVHHHDDDHHRVVIRHDDHDHDHDHDVH
jgi:hypothetical protein